MILVKRMNAWVQSITPKHTHTHTRGGAHTQQLGDVVKCLTKQEDLPITTRVARETLLASMLVLLRLHKVSRYVVVFGDHSMACHKRQGL